MAIPNTETLLPQLLAEYTDSRRVDLGLPTAEELPFVTGPTKEEQIFPRVMFVAAETSFPHPRRMNLTVTAELQTGTDTQDVPEENIWTAGIRYALADKLAFLAWLDAQTEEKRTGYEVRKMRLDDAGMAADDKNKLRGRRTSVILHVRTDELAPPQPA